MRPPVYALLLPVLAIAWFCGCGGGDESPDRTVLEAYFAQIQAFNDEYQVRRDDAGADFNECIVLNKQGRSRGNSPSREVDADPATCIAEYEDASLSARQRWLENIRSMKPPPAVKDAHGVLTRNASTGATTPGPLTPMPAGETPVSSIPTIDPRNVIYLEACDQLIAVAKANGIPLRLWCAIESSP